MSANDPALLVKHVRKISRYEGITQGQASVLLAAADALEASQAELAELRVENARLRVAGEPLRRANRKARAAHDREIAAKALEDYADELDGISKSMDYAMDESDWDEHKRFTSSLRARAAEYRNPEGNDHD